MSPTFSECVLQTPKPVASESILCLNGRDTVMLHNHPGGHFSPCYEILADILHSLAGLTKSHDHLTACVVHNNLPGRRGMVRVWLSTQTWVLRPLMSLY